jgi:hypothetical protein
MGIYKEIKGGKKIFTLLRGFLLIMRALQGPLWTRLSAARAPG